MTAEQWYSGLLLNIRDRLGLEDELDEFWEEHERLSPVPVCIGGAQPWSPAVALPYPSSSIRPNSCDAPGEIRSDHGILATGVGYISILRHRSHLGYILDGAGRSVEPTVGGWYIPYSAMSTPCPHEVVNRYGRNAPTADILSSRRVRRQARRHVSASCGPFTVRFTRTRTTCSSGCPSTGPCWILVHAAATFSRTSQNDG